MLEIPQQSLNEQIKGNPYPMPIAQEDRKGDGDVPKDSSIDEQIMQDWILNIYNYATIVSTCADFLMLRYIQP